MASTGDAPVWHGRVGIPSGNYGCTGLGPGLKDMIQRRGPPVLRCSKSVIPGSRDGLGLHQNQHCAERSDDAGYRPFHPLIIGLRFALRGQRSRRRCSPAAWRSCGASE